ncbi:MAG: ROK family glucokinase [Clostridia bacterium]|nr:ROK family glucokinase [Clostridia bacterium]
MKRIGIDLGGTNIAAGVWDDDSGRLLSKMSRKTRLPRPAEEIMQDMAAAAQEALAAAGLTAADAASLGVGCPGTCNLDTGVVEYANNLQFKQVPLRQRLQELTGLPVFLENDANAAALGEAVAGAARGAENCVCITLGTGVGGGILIGGKIYNGYNFAGAELGHIVIVVDGEACTCGRRGCWEAYASATALIRQTRAAMQQHPDSLLWQWAPTLDAVNGRTAFDAMRAGDAVGKQVVDRYIYYIACGLINVVNIFQPEVLCIGGGICHEGETLLAPLRRYIEQERYSKYSARQTRLTVASLGNDAGIIGAAVLALHQG